MPAYVIVEIETTDREEMQRYRDLAAPTVVAHGGRYIVRGGATQTLEGDWEPARVVVLEFADTDQARGWWECEGYREAKELRQRAGRTRMILVEGV